MWYVCVVVMVVVYMCVCAVVVVVVCVWGGEWRGCPLPDCGHESHVAKPQSAKASAD